MRKLMVVACMVAGLLVAGVSPKPSLAKETPAKPIRHILIAAGRTTSPWYPLCQALAKFINKKSDWLRAEVVSTAGITGNADMIKEKPKDYIGVDSFSHVHYRPGHPWSEKRGTYTGMRFIANCSSETHCIVTYDSKIKTIQDLAGKIVDVGRKGGANTVDHKAILEKYGVLDKVKLVYTGYGGGANKLKDGLVDATMLMFDHIYPRKFSKGGFIEKLETRAPVYYVGFDRDTLLQLREKEYATVPVWVPAGALDPKTQPQAFWATNIPTFLMADQRMDEDVVYEITRIVWETPAEQWANWHPIGAHMNDKFKPAMPSLNLYKAHPGAKKFYDEHGIDLKDLADLLR